MATFRKKPVEVEAVKIRDLVRAARESWTDLPDWVAQAYELGLVLFMNDGISVTTLEGEMIGGLDWWLIRGVEGELYPCKPSVFDTTYEPVESSDDSQSSPAADA